jgi:hypothetical protein
VKLQTFFRGNKLRYFEVASPPETDTAVAVLFVATNDDDEEEENVEDEEHDEQRNDADTARLHEPQVSTPSENFPRSFIADLNLEMLTYFHHFTTTTSLTLPDVDSTQPTSLYWQTNVVLQALQQRWLMCGLLAISACHLAVFTDDMAMNRVHCERFAQFFTCFSTGWDEITKTGLSELSATAEQNSKKVGRQIRCMLNCAHWALAESMPVQEVLSEQAVSFELHSAMTTVRGFFAPDFALRPSGSRSDEDDHREEANNASNARRVVVSPSKNNTPSTILNRLHALPFRMADAFGKPDNAQDVFAALSAIAALVECCEASFASDEVGTTWRGMATWLTKIPDHFNQLVSHHNPAALVVLAHWAVFLVKRAEQCGCWFLNGLAKTIMLEIAERLPAEDSAVQNLVGSLMA